MSNVKTTELTLGDKCLTIINSIRATKATCGKGGDLVDIKEYRQLLVKLHECDELAFKTLLSLGDKALEYRV